MKCLSIRQPWPYHILLGFKQSENRTWPTTYRGHVLIHASKKADSGEAARAYRIDEHLLTRSAIVGYAYLSACVPIGQMDEFPLGRKQLAQGFARNIGTDEKPSFCFIFERAQAFAKPIPYSGRLGLFEVPDEIVRRQLAKVQTVFRDDEDLIAPAEIAWAGLPPQRAPT